MDEATSLFIPHKYSLPRFELYLFLNRSTGFGYLSVKQNHQTRPDSVAYGFDLHGCADDCRMGSR